MSESKSFDLNKTIEQIKGDRNLMMVVGGYFALVLSLFLPWASVNVLGISVTANPGLDSTGIFLLIMSITGIGAALNVLEQDKRSMYMISLVAAAVALLIVLVNYPESELGLVSVSFGYYIAVLGSMIALIGVAMLFKTLPKSTKTPASSAVKKSEAKDDAK